MITIYRKYPTDFVRPKNVFASVINQYPGAKIVLETKDEFTWFDEGPKLAPLLKSLQEGDVLVLAYLDRLQRVDVTLGETLSELHARGIRVLTWAEKVDTFKKEGQSSMSSLTSRTRYKTEAVKNSP